MAYQDVTELVIDADTSGADQYSSAMDKAATSAESTIGSAQAAALAIAGVGAASIGALAGLRGFVDYVGGQTQVLVDMAERARLAGISTREFQQILLAARTSGLSEKDFNSGFDKLASDITDAGRGVTQFGKLLEMNGVSLRSQNGELKTTGVVIKDLANLVQNASPQVAQKIAEISGVTKAWVPFLRQGAEGIEAAKKEAEALGVVIDDSMIQQAEEFNRQWKQAVGVWDLQLKASLTQLLPLMIQLADYAIKVINAVGAVTAEVSRWVTPDDKKTKTQLDGQIDQAMQLLDLMDKIGKSTSDIDNGMVKFKSQRGLAALGLPEDSDVKTLESYIAKLRELYNTRPSARVPISGGTTVLPPTGGGEKADALENEIQRIEKHIAVIKADTEAVGQGEAARAGLRAEASLYAAAEKAGITDLEKYADGFFKLREQIESVTAALLKARVNSDIKFGQQTVGLSQESVQIAQQLRGIYPDVEAALNSTEAAQMRVLNLQKDLSAGFQDVGKSMFGAFLSGKNVMDAMVQSLDNVAKKLADKAFDNLLEGALTGNPAQMAIGAVQAGASALITVFTGDQKAKKALQEAKDEWAKAAPAFENFMKTLSGGVNGSLATTFMQLGDRVYEFLVKATKAEDWAAVTRASDAYNASVYRATDSFKQSFGGMLDAINAGLGPDSPFSAASTNIKAVGETLKGFIDDVRVAYANDRVAAAQGGQPLIAGGGESQIAEATAAAQRYMLSLLGQSPVLSETAAAIQKVNGTAVQLRSVLFDLGVTAEDAAASIDAGVVAAMRELATKFTDSLQREINEAVGQSYLNSTADLIAKRTASLGDAALLGTGTDLVDRWFSVQAQKLVDEAKLTGDAFAQLVAAFPQLQGVVHSFIDQAEIDASATAAAQARMQEAQTQLQTATSDLTSAYQAQSSALEATISSMTSYISGLRKLQDSLKLNDSLSPLSAQEKYLEAQRQFRDTFALAQGGDSEAQSRVQEALTAYLDQSKSFNASTAAYYADFTEAQGSLAALEAAGQRQLTTAQQELALLNQQVSGLIAINNLVMSVAQAIANLAAAQGNLNSQRDWGSRPEINRLLVQGMQSLGINYTGNFGANSGFQEWVNSQVQSVQDAIYQIASAIPTSLIDFYARQGLQNGGIVGSFANGGVIGNGTYGVDSVVARYAGGGNIALAGGEYVMPANQTRANLPMLEAMRSGRGAANNDNGAVVAELRAVRAELAALRQTTAAAGQHVGSRVDASAGVQKQSAAETRQATNRPAPYGTRKAG